MLSSAKRRAASGTESLLRLARSSAIMFQWPGGVEVPRSSFQNGVLSVSYSVRSELSRAPRLATKLSCSAYSFEPSVSGGGQRNCSGDVITNGVTWPQNGRSGGRNAEGVSRHLPCSTLEYLPGIGLSKPLFARPARMALPTFSPQAMPSVLAWPSGIL